MDRKIESESPVFLLSFSAAGDAIHGLCQDRKLRTFDAKTGAVRDSFSLEEGAGNPSLIAASLTVVAKDGTIKSYDLAAGKIVRSLKPSGARSARTVASGKLITSAYRPSMQSSDNAVRVFDEAGKEKFSVPAGIGGVSVIAVSPDGNSVVAGSYDADVRAWSARNGELLRLIDEIPVSMFDMRFSPDGKWLVAGGADRTIYVYDTKTWRLARKFPPLPELVSALSFSADGRLLASGGFNEITVKHPVKVIIWDFASAKPVRTVDSPHRVTSLALSPDGKTVAVTSGEKTIDLWQVSA